jgi:tetratricopeptide (TPR) repeat protein
LFHHYCQLRQYDAAFDALRECDEFLTLQGHSTILIERYGLLEGYWRNEAWQPEPDNQWKIHALLMDLGNAYSSSGECQRAIDFYQQSLEITRQIGDRKGEASSLMGLGSAYSSLGEYQHAIDFYQQSVEIKRQIGDRRGEALSLQNLGVTCNKLGKAREGFAASHQAIQILQDLDLPLKAMPYPNWFKRTIQFAQRGKGQLLLCFALGIVAFPFALVWQIGLLAWRILRGWVRPR